MRTRDSVTVTTVSPWNPARRGLAGPAFTTLLGAWWADLLVALGTAAAARPASPPAPS